MYLMSHLKNVIALIAKIYKIHAMHGTSWLFNAIHGKATLKPTGFAAYSIYVRTYMPLQSNSTINNSIAWFVIFKASM